MYGTLHETEKEAEQERQIKITELNNKTCPIYFKSGMCLNCASFYFGEITSNKSPVMPLYKGEEIKEVIYFSLRRPPECLNAHVRGRVILEQV